MMKRFIFFGVFFCCFNLVYSHTLREDRINRKNNGKLVNKFASNSIQEDGFTEKEIESIEGKNFQKEIQAIISRWPFPKSKFFGGKFYSQYFEDFILAYVFRDVGRGFYVDVGAAHPEDASVTKYFYERGWRGINIEPQNYLIDLFNKLRPDDINICQVVSDCKEEVTFYLPPSHLYGLASMSEDANIWLSQRGVSVGTETVFANTLTNIFDSYKVGEIHFLKIDVEGCEDKVLRGLDLRLFRPHVIIVEVASPHDLYGYLKSQPILLQNGYKFGMSDDLNHYYYREESSYLAERFREIRQVVILDKLMRGAFLQNEDFISY